MTPDEINVLAEKTVDGIDLELNATQYRMLIRKISAAVAEAVKQEREACANICNSPEIYRESYQLDLSTGKGYNLAMRDIAAAIRARGGAK